MQNYLMKMKIITLQGGEIKHMTKINNKNAAK